MNDEKIDLNALVAKLGQIHDLRELEGFANRRRYCPSLRRWTDDERALILAKKYELEKRHGKYQRTD